VGVKESLRRVCQIVEATQPATGAAFQWLDPEQGVAPALEDAHEGPERLFELAAVGPVDAGEGGCVSARIRIVAALRIRYRTAGSRHARLAQQAEDVRRLRDALMFTPAGWLYSSTGLHYVLMDAAEPAAPIVPVDPLQGPAHEIVNIPITLEVDP